MNGIDSPTLIAWDSCVFLAHFNQETGKPLAEIEGILRQIEKGRKTLLVSAIVRAEVLNHTGTFGNAGTLFCEFCKRSTVIRADADFRIADEAAGMRERVKNVLDPHGRPYGIKAPDALIAATAIIYKATALHTFDPVLLALSENQAIKELKTMKPDSGQAHNQPLF